MKTLTIDNKVFEVVTITDGMRTTHDICAQCDGHFDDHLCEKLPDCKDTIYKEVKNGTAKKS